MEETLTEIEQLRHRIYTSYRKLKDIGRGDEIDFPDHLSNNGYIYTKDTLEEQGLDGHSFLVGKEISRESLGGEGYTGIIVRSRPNGIMPYEDFTRTSFKPMFIASDDITLIADLSSLKRNQEKLGNYTPKEVIGLNFDLFPLLKNLKRNLSEDDYMAKYLEVYAEYPLYF